MELEINQTKHSFSLPEITAGSGSDQEALSLDALMAFLYPQTTDGLAVAISDQVIEKALWPKTFLKEKDKLLILTATQGG